MSRSRAYRVERAAYGQGNALARNHCETCGPESLFHGRVCVTCGGVFTGAPVRDLSKFIPGETMPPAVRRKRSRRSRIYSGGTLGS